MYLRHYAFLRRHYPRQPAKAIYHFATLGLSALLSLALLALLSAASLAVSLMLARPIVPWSLPDWALVVGAAALAFVPGWAIDVRFRTMVDVDPETIELFSSDENRRKWWLMALSILPISAVMGACFAVLRVWQNS